MKYAILELGGKQLWVEPEKYYSINSIKAEQNTLLHLGRILLVRDEDKIEMGQPYLKNKKIKAKVLSHSKGPKLIVYKMRPKKKTRKKQGHRQHLTKIYIINIENT